MNNLIMEAEKKENTSAYPQQISTSMSFSSFMTAVVIFFVGIILSRYSEYDSAIRVPICFLILATFGFLYSALIYANSSEEMIQGKIKNYKRNMFIGDILSEYFGVYFLVLSIPLAINIIASDVYLRTTVALASLIGFSFYQFSHFSISERHFPKHHKLISFFIIGVGIILFFSQMVNFYFEFFSIILVIFIFGMVIFALRKKEARTNVLGFIKEFD